MGKIILCMGTCAAIPYDMKSANIRLYSVEELCFWVTENIHLVDNSIMTQKLTDWLERECSLRELANYLLGYINAKVPVSVFVSALLEYTGYCSKENIKLIENVMKENAALSMHERIKRGADYFMERRQFGAALEAYGRLELELTQENKELLAEVLYNKATILAHLYLFEAAADLYKRAYELLPERKTYMKYVSALKLLLPPDEYAVTISKDEGAQAEDTELIKRMADIEEAWQTSKEKKEIDEFKKLKDSTDVVQYYELVGTSLNKWKDEFRLQTTR